MKDPTVQVPVSRGKGTSPHLSSEVPLPSYCLKSYHVHPPVGNYCLCGEAREGNMCLHSAAPVNSLTSQQLSLKPHSLCPALLQRSQLLAKGLLWGAGRCQHSRLLPLNSKVVENSNLCFRPIICENPWVNPYRDPCQKLSSLLTCFF